MKSDSEESRESHHSKGDYRESEEEEDIFESDNEDDSIDEMNEEELNEELELPKTLWNIPLKEKIELLRFKRIHNEREWEEEIMERENEIGKKIDYERLKKLIGKDKDDSTSKKKDTKKAPAAKTQRGGKNKKSAVKSDSEQSDVDDFEKKSSENEMDLVAEDGEVVESDSEDDLFNSDEEEEITRRTQAENKNVVDAGDDEEDDSDAAPNGNSKSKVLGKKRKSSGSSKRNRAKRSKRGKRYDSDSDDEDDEDEDDEEEEEEEGNLEEEEEEEEEGSGREDEYDREDSNLQDIKNSFKRRNEDGNRPGGRAAAIKAPTYHSLSELKQHYEKQLQKDLPIKPDDKDPADHMDIKKLFKRRDEVIRLLNEPFFEELIVGCFVRYLIGIVDNLQVYRMCEVIAVDRTKRSYKLPPLANGEVVETTVRLTLSNAGEIKSNQKLDKLSNHTISEKEIDFHLEGMRSRKKAEYTKRQLRLTRNHHKQYADHVYNHSEISGMIAKKELNRLLTTEYTAAMESLKKDLEKAKAAEDPNNEQIEFISKEIRKLEKIDEKQKEIFERNLKRQTEINHRMRESNVKRDMEAGMKKRTEEQAAIAKGILPNAISDPFIRRETRPKILWDTRENLQKRKEEKEAKEKEEKEKGKKEKENKVNKDVLAVGKKTRLADEDRWAISQLSLSEVRNNIKKRINVDPYEAAMLPKKERYLRKVCLWLPPVGSQERERLRGVKNKSLKDYIQLMKEGNA